MMCYYLNVHFQGERVNIKIQKTFSITAQFISCAAHQQLYTLITLATLILNPLPDLQYLCRRSTSLTLLEKLKVEIFFKTSET